jgi:predicted restriction endonuclease
MSSDELTAFATLAGVLVAVLFGTGGVVVGIVGLVQSSRAKKAANRANKLAKEAKTLSAEANRLVKKANNVISAQAARENERSDVEWEWKWDTSYPDHVIIQNLGKSLTPGDQEILGESEVSETEKQALVLARRGQGLFRNRVRVFEPRCRVTHASSDRLLIASHIKPWKKAKNDERLDGNNGLFLSPHIDKLFDVGFITFTPNGKMQVSDMLDRDVLPKWSIDPTNNVGAFSTDQVYFLDYHLEHQFLR